MEVQSETRRVRGHNFGQLLADLSRNRQNWQFLGSFAQQAALLLPKVIVFSGHGRWALGKDSYVQVPGKCSIKFYTMNMRLMSDGLGGDIDRGLINGLIPDQEAGPFRSVPDMRLFPPSGLNIRTPDPMTWQVVTYPCQVPKGTKNLQIKINQQHRDGASLSVLFNMLAPAIESANSVVFLWAACREINLKKAGGKKLGVNTMQR